MSAPLLFVNADDEYRNIIEAAPVIPDFTTVHPEGEQDWISDLKASQARVALVKSDHFTSDDYERLIGSHLLGKLDLIFLSSGVPNEYIDKIMQIGACYHLRAPVDVEFLNELLTEIHTELCERSVSSDRVVSSELDQFGLLVGSSKPMHRLYRLLRKASDSDAKVLIIGESGTGKELVANTIHHMSDRHDKPFVALNCGALSPELVESELFGHVKGAFTGANKNREGVFAEADGGTLFLDEITEMPLDLQVKLLRVLESGEYRAVGSDSAKHADVRIIAATNRDPTEAIEQETFRSDLYFRLASFPVYIPPLRERGEDVEGLAKHFLAYRNSEEHTSKGITEAALRKIKAYDWPGNVRELKHVVERAFLLSLDTIDSDHIIIEPYGMELDGDHGAIPKGLTLKELEQQAIMETLEENHGKKVETAKQLGISVKTLYNKLDTYEKADNAEKN
ncbi:MAG: sigma-54 dependent transcriptional regulator [Ketobacteraceae bacterium]|nr:sigma-54 dependent transcriptional regulator [Ketobacteraceae bacterium]